MKIIILIIILIIEQTRKPTGPTDKRIPGGFRKSKSCIEQISNVKLIIIACRITRAKNIYTTILDYESV